MCFALIKGLNAPLTSASFWKFIWGSQGSFLGCLPVRSVVLDYQMTLFTVDLAVLTAKIVLHPCQVSLDPPHPNTTTTSYPLPPLLPQLAIWNSLSSEIWNCASVALQSKVFGHPLVLSQSNPCNHRLRWTPSVPAVERESEREREGARVRDSQGNGAVQNPCQRGAMTRIAGNIVPYFSVL